MDNNMSTSTDDKISKTNNEVITKKDDNVIDLQLGDVIKITDPENEILNNNTFIIDYIDSSVIRLIDTDSLVTTLLKIHEDKTIGNGTITAIHLLSRSENPGYARQNNLLPNTWVNIYFGGEIPTIITGEITNLEEDMIEIKLFPEENIIYINFDYKGIPLDIPIETIEIREKPESKTAVEREEEEKEQVNEYEEPEQQQKQQKQMTEEIDKPELTNEDISNFPIPETSVKNQLRELILKGDQITFGEEELGPVVQYVNIGMEKQRYSIEMQTNDLLDELLSTIPNSQRTSKVLNNIHIMIERFKQLRKDFSIFDINGNIEGFIKKGADWKPLVKELQEFKKILFWILPVASNIKKLYDVFDLDENKTADENTFSDISLLSIIDSLDIMKTIINNYYSNNNSMEENKYVTMINDLNGLFTPFNNLNSENTKDIIFESIVNNDINVIIDNLGDFYSSISENDIIKTKKFVINKYNLGLKKLVATNITGSRMLVQSVNLTKNDDISIKSILTLPEPTIRFSRINLPGTNLLEKANLNTTFLQYWKLLNKKTNFTNIDVDQNELDEEIEFDEISFINDIRNYTLSNTDKNGNIDFKTQYINFLKKIIPKTRVLFKMIKKYIKGKLSITDVVGFLEPFLIYTDDLTYMQYTEITKFLDEKISEYNKNFIERSRIFNILKNMKPFQDYNPSTKAIYSIFKNNISLKNNVFESYDYNPSNNDNSSLPLTNSELIKKIIVKDFGNLYNSSVSLQNTSLMFSNNLDDILNVESKEIKSNKGSEEEQNKCKTFIIAKQYRTLEELMADNDKEIYFDKQYDNTIYSILDDFHKEMSQMNPEDFLEFLVNKLKSKIKLNQIDAEYLAETLINGIKKVINGQYALLYSLNEDKMHYYKRYNNKWVLDDTVDNEVFANNDDLLCNIQDNCIEVVGNQDKCESFELNKAELKETTMKNVLNEFDKKYEISKEEFQEKLKSRFEYYSSIIDKISNIDFEKMFKYNNQQFKIGIKTEEEDKNIVVSPYAKLRDLILGQSDFVKKQYDILKFSQKFTREAYFNEETDVYAEDKHWLYCIQTGMKILPIFLKMSANVFVNENENYNKYIDILIKDIGTLSDDGDAWVDKYSGYVIKSIDFDVEEGYDDGFKIRSREIMEQDLGDSIIKSSQIQATKKVETVEVKTVMNIVNALSSSIGINIESQSEFIKRNVITTLSETMPSETSYKKQIQEMAKKGKTNLPSYEDLYNSSILYLTIGLFLIAIQTNIPSIKTRKTFPGCVRSFSGYPLEGSGDDSGVHYLACIAYNIRTTIKPWNVLLKKKEDFIASKIKETIQTYLWNLPDVKRKIDEKTEYLVSNPQELDIPQEYDISRWKEFLPPLVPFRIKNLVNITSEFKTRLKHDLDKGLKEQREKILVIESKIIQFSLAIQESIQKVVHKKQLLLKNAANEAFLENSCCNEKGQYTTIQYFEKENPDIGTYNNIVNDLTNILYDIHNITQADFLFCKENTKNNYPPLSDDFNEETIYRAFIVFCKFNSLIPLTEDLLALCNEKPEFSLSKYSISESIKKLKQDGRNYTNESLLRLLQIVNRNNIVHVEMSSNNDGSNTSSIQKINDMINIFKTENDSIIKKSLINVLEPTLDTFDISVTEDTNEMRSLKNYLATNNKNIRERIIDFITKNKNMNGREFKNIKQLLTNVFTWSDDSKRNNEMNKLYDEDGYNVFQFMKNYTNDLIKTFPNIILNKVNYDNFTASKHWDLSSIHNMNISKIVKEYYSKFNKFYEDKTLTVSLNAIQQRCKNLILLVNETPYFSAIQYKDKTVYSIFDKRTCSLLFEHYVLLVFSEYINICENESILFEYNVKENINVDNVFTVESLENNNDLREDAFINRTNEENDISLTGNRKQLKVQTANLLAVYLVIMNNHKDLVDKTYENVMDKVFKLQEREKIIVTDRLELMSEEERNADTILKINKLGVWSKGLQKGLRSYVKETYDQDREFIEKLHQVEKNVRKNTNVNDNNVEQYMEDYLENMEVEQQIEHDVFDISDMNDDYMDGMYDPNDIGNTADIDYEEYY